jgi:fucose 4-O-acetylase-like acetyltransferase
MEELPQTPANLEPITSGMRSQLVDIVKGAAIILVAYGHTAQGVVHRGWWTVRGADFSRSLIYSFHMPAFFFIAGLFVRGSISRRGARGVAVEKWKTILYPYLLFSLIFAAVQPLVGRFEFRAAPFQWKVFLLHLVDGDASWFLFVLFFCFMLALLTSRLPNWLRFLVAAVVGMTPAFGPPLTNQVLREFCFLAAGMWVERTSFGWSGCRWLRLRLGLACLLQFRSLRFITLERPPSGPTLYLALLERLGCFCWLS